MKRLYDLLVSTICLILLSPLLLFVALVVRFDSPGPIVYRGLRIGRGGKPFRICKFRTMVVDAAERGGGITHREDPRVTRVGRWLRRTKADELPQLWNVLWGEMSLVGPRPEDPRYVERYSLRQRKLLSVRPGITSVASIRYRNEEALLSPEDWEAVYLNKILPAKLDIELKYLATQSLGQDLLVLVGTLFALLQDEAQYFAWARAVEDLETFTGRYVSWPVLDFFLIVLAYRLALAVRSIDASLDWPAAGWQVLLSAAVYVLVNFRCGVYQTLWRCANTQDAVKLLGSMMVATGILTAVDLYLPQRAIPLGALLLGSCFSLALLGTFRFRRKLWSGARSLLQTWLGYASGIGARVLIVGAGEEGQLLAWQLQEGVPGEVYSVVGFVDADRRTHGLRIHNAPVYGDVKLIPDLVMRWHIDIILISVPPSRVENPRELLALCQATPAQIRVAPALSDWIGQNGHEPSWGEMGKESLLERAPYQVDEKQCHELIANRVVMVTGAAGSIGSELCRQIATHCPRRLVLVDNNESGLHDLQVELQAIAPGLPYDLALCDITHASCLRAVFQQTCPHIVFHAAAYKHVPLLERHPQEGVRVNIRGTQLVHTLSQQMGVERFLLISTDKAVNPTSVLGQTKRIAEMIVTAPPALGSMRSTVVRFGNVLGSRGSVIPTFERQIELGGPVTITDPEMTRYFLTIGEAVGLVVEAAAVTQGGDIFILDMGVPIKIMDLAQRLIRLRGLRPGRDIPLKVIGPRPGEKVSEELVGEGEETVPTEHPSLLRVRRVAPLNTSQLEREVELLVAYSEGGADPEAVRTRLQRCLAELEAGGLAGEPLQAYPGPAQPPPVLLDQLHRQAAGAGVHA